MADPFEEPAKTRMRSACEIAIDQAGHELVAKPAAVSLPEGTAIRGRLKGDLQSIDGDGNRYCYYLRPHAGDTLPEWLANLAVAAHDVPGAKLYVVVEEASPALEKASKTAGAGLLILNEDAELEMVLDFDKTLPEAMTEEFRGEIERVRRSLETKVDLNQTNIRARFERIGDLTQGMAEDVAEKYSEGVERQYRIWTDWGHTLSEALDRALADRSLERLAEIERDIEAGPVLDEDVLDEDVG